MQKVFTTSVDKEIATDQLAANVPVRGNKPVGQLVAQHVTHS